MAKEKKNEYVTEFLRGIVDYASVHKPKNKYGKENSKFPNDKEFSVTMRMDDTTTRKQFESLLKKHNAALQVKNPQTMSMVDRIRANKDGKLQVQFKSSAVDFDGNERELQVVYADKKPVPKDVLIGNGSEVILALTFSKDAVTKETKSIFLSGLQVIKLNKYNAVEFGVVPGGDVGEDENIGGNVTSDTFVSKSEGHF